jgi:hypothetical protein
MFVPVAILAQVLLCASAAAEHTKTQTLAAARRIVKAKERCRAAPTFRT